MKTRHFSSLCTTSRRAAPLCAVLAALACGDDEVSVTTETETNEGSVFAAAAELATPEGDIYYLGTTPDLSAPFDLVRDGIEIFNASNSQSIGEQVFVAPNDAPTITRYVLGDDGRLREDETLSFAGVGVSSARAYTLVSETKAYLFDFATYTAHIWSPAEMTLTGDEIDLSAARNDERGAFSLFPWKYYHVRRDNLLFIPGEWSNDDGSVPHAVVAVFDTETDSVTFTDDARCSQPNAAKLTDSGDIYFLSHNETAFNNGLMPCALVIRAGETTFAPDYFQDLLPLMDGRVPQNYSDGPGNTIYTHATHQEQSSAETLEELVAIRNNARRLWQIDLPAGTAVEVEEVDFFRASRWTMDVGDGRGLVPIRRLNDSDDESAGSVVEIYEVYEQDRPVLFDFGEDSNDVRNRLTSVVRLR
jgi:hypothetical protein